MKNKFVKGAALLTLSTGILFSGLPTNYNSIVKAQKTSKVEQVLSALTPAQREAIKNLKLSDQGEGLQLSPQVDQTSTASTSVIVEFKDKPQKTAMLMAEEEGKTLSETDAQDKVNASHEKFGNDLKTIFKKDLKDNKNPYKIKRSYKKSFNGVAMTVPANRVKDLLKSDAVKAIYSDLKEQIEPPTLGQGSAKQAEKHTMVTFPGIEKLHKEGYTGKGIKVGIIDTGIDYNHPDLKGAYKGGYDFVDNDNDPMETTYDDWKKSGKDEISLNGETYYTEHGTHVAGILAGQGKNKNTDEPVEGVAPDADIYSYRVLGPYGSGSSSNIIAAIDKAVSDGMDIISMSLGANYNDPLYPDAIAVNNAVLAGVTAVVAAGNDGNKMYSLGSPGTSPLAITVGANDTSVTIPKYPGTAHTTTGDLPADMKLAAKGMSDNIADFQGQTLQMVNVDYGGEVSYWLDNAKTKPIDVKGKVVLAQRGSFSIAQIISTAKSHGAKAVVLYDSPVPSGDVYLADGYNYIPTFLISNAQGKAIAKTLPTSGQGSIPGASIDFAFGDMSQIVTQGNELADFSSRGPSRVLYDIKPEVTAPGVSVYSSVPSYMHGADQIGIYQYAYDRLSGTSMATPQVSGVAALLKQAHPDMTPADIKATLMNTADPLNGDYSVYEVGSGVVDPYKAVHAQTEMVVQAKTETVKNSATSSNGPTTLASKGVKTIKDDTGAISFGEQAVNGKDLKDSRSITIYNHGYQNKTFNVQVKFQTISSRFTNDTRADNDASANGVTLDVKPVVTVKKSGKVNMDAIINVPAAAKLGTYEGYVVYTNKDNPDETYRIPFAIHTVQEGIDYVKGDPSAFTLPYEAGSNKTRWSIGLDFKLKSHMRTFDFFLVDPKSNQEIGYLGTADGMGADENIDYYFRGVLSSGQYYPLTGDPDNPISFDFNEVTPGLYKIRMVGTNDEGKTFTSDAPVYYGVKEPKVTMNYEAGQIVETASPTDKNVTVTGTAFDPDIATMQAAGIDASQGDNYVTYYNPSNSAEINIPVDGQGNFNATIPLATAGPIALPITEYDFTDYDKSTVRNYDSLRDVYFVKKGTAYTTAISNKQRINMGDTTTVTFSMKNVTTNVKQAVYSFLIPSQYIDVVDATPHGNYNGKLDVQYTSAPHGGYSLITITATATGNLAKKGIVGDKSLVDMTFKAKDIYSKAPIMFKNPNGSRFFTATYTNVDNSTVTTQGINPYFYITPTYSLMRGAVQAEGLMTFTGLEPEMKQLDYNKAGTKISVTDTNGKEYGVTDPLGYSDGFPFSFRTRLPFTSKPFTLKIDVPGHFTFMKDFTIGINNDGNITAGSKPVDYNYIPGGDVNKDGVIDVKDALYIEQYWNTNKRDADINYDGVVDKKDMQYVVNNYLMQNPWDDNAPKANKKYKGKTLDDVLKNVGME